MDERVYEVLPDARVIPSHKVSDLKHCHFDECTVYFIPNEVESHFCSIQCRLRHKLYLRSQMAQFHTQMQVVHGVTIHQFT